MIIVATTSLPTVDRTNADRWNAARSCQKLIYRWGPPTKGLLIPMFSLTKNEIVGQFCLIKSTEWQMSLLHIVLFLQYEYQIVEGICYIQQYPPDSGGDLKRCGQILHPRWVILVIHLQNYGNNIRKALSLVWRFFSFLSFFLLQVQNKVSSQCGPNSGEVLVK